MNPKPHPGRVHVQPAACVHNCGGAVVTIVAGPSDRELGFRTSRAQMGGGWAARALVRLGKSSTEKSCSAYQVRGWGCGKRRLLLGRATVTSDGKGTVWIRFQKGGWGQGTQARAGDDRQSDRLFPFLWRWPCAGGVQAVASGHREQKSPHRRAVNGRSKKPGSRQGRGGPAMPYRSLGQISCSGSVQTCEPFAGSPRSRWGRRVASHDRARNATLACRRYRGGDRSACGDRSVAPAVIVLLMAAFLRRPSSVRTARGVGGGIRDGCILGSGISGANSPRCEGRGAGLPGRRKGLLRFSSWRYTGRGACLVIGRRTVAD